MGKKISWEDAEKLGKLDTTEDGILMPPNKYGYRVNISHPAVRPLYEKYKKSVNEMILSDEQRRTFEMHIITALQRKGVKI